jgi:hypothetical protein
MSTSLYPQQNEGRQKIRKDLLELLTKKIAKASRINGSKVNICGSKRLHHHNRSIQQHCGDTYDHQSRCIHEGQLGRQPLNFVTISLPRYTKPFDYHYSIHDLRFTTHDLRHDLMITFQLPQDLIMRDLHKKRFKRNPRLHEMHVQSS